LNRWQPLYLLGCIGLSTGLNHVMQPKVDYALSAGERTMTTGSLTFEQEGRIYRFKLATIHVVTADVPRLLADPFSVRALWVRSPEESGQAAPDVELLFDMAEGAPAPIDPATRDVAQLRSRVRLPGTEAPLVITGGDFVIDEALQLQKGDPSQGFRVRGDLHLTTEVGDRQQLLSGKLDARLVW
jgi:hypothetical protein